MTYRRLMSLVFDILSPGIPVYFASIFSNVDFINTFAILFLLTLIIESILFKGKTLGSLLFKIEPVNISNKELSLFKMILYYIALSIIIVNILPTSNGIYFKIFLPIFMLTPIYFPNEKRYHSILDVIFRIHWRKLEG